MRMICHPSWKHLIRAHATVKLAKWKHTALTFVYLAVDITCHQRFISETLMSSFKLPQLKHHFLIVIHCNSRSKLHWFQDMSTLRSQKFGRLRWRITVSPTWNYITWKLYNNCNYNYNWKEKNNLKHTANNSESLWGLSRIYHDRLTIWLTYHFNSSYLDMTHHVLTVLFLKEFCHWWADKRNHSTNQIYYHSWIRDDHTTHFTNIILPFCLIQFQQIWQLSLFTKHLGTSQHVIQHFVHWQNFLAVVCNINKPAGTWQERFTIEYHTAIDTSTKHTEHN